jgi:TatD DNase family protein
MLADSHCHIHLLPDYPACIESTLAEAKAADLHWLLNVGTSLEDMPELIKLAAYDPVYISAGVHPNEQPGVVFSEEILLKAVNSHPKVIAIGETGLDYYRQDNNTEDLSWQRDRFITHMQVAKLAQKPLIIHSRQARQDTIDLLRSEQASVVGGVMHCFTEDWAMAQAALDLGFYISFSGIVTFKNAHELQEVAQKVPLNRMLIETDCPYLAPIPFRGKPNQPAYVKYTAAFIAELRGLDFETLAEATTQNFMDLFGAQINKLSV